jgi:hypothetical protein
VSAPLPSNVPPSSPSLRDASAPAPAGWAGLLRRALEGTAITLGYAMLALWLLSPLFSDPSRKVVDPMAGTTIGGGGWVAAPDINLMLWILAWDWHALTTMPSKLFQANFFHPAPFARAGCEHMLGHLPIFGPVYALSGNPVLANQMNILLSIALCGTFMYALLRHWGVSRAAALFGGFVYAFCPMRAYGASYEQLIAVQYLPLALLFLDRTLTRVSGMAAVSFAGCLFLQLLCSYYTAYMTVFAVSGYAIGVLWVSRARLPRRGIVLAVGSALAAGLGMVAVSLPYLRLRDLGMAPDYQQSFWLQVSAAGLWKNYLYPTIAVREWGYKLDSGNSLYVGILPLAFALAGLLRRRRAGKDPSAWAPAATLGLTAACYVMALGPELALWHWSIPLPYSFALRVVPGFSALRGTSRFGFGVMLGIAALAGLGFDRAVRQLPARHSWWIAPAALMMFGAGTAGEYDLFRTAYAVRSVKVGNEVPAVYRALTQLPPGAVLEVPIGGEEALNGLLLESEYMYYSTVHWQPLLNGYAGYIPPTYRAVVALARSLPNRRSVEILARATGLQYVIVHFSQLPDEQRERWAALLRPGSSPEGLRLISSFENDSLFGLAEPARPDLMPAFIDFAVRSTTILGTPLQPLLDDGRRASITLVQAPPSAAIFPVFIDVMLTNQSQARWPALASREDHLVTIEGRWEDDAGHAISDNFPVARVPYDLDPGQSVRVLLHVNMPGRVGPARLLVNLTQEGKWFLSPALSIRFDVLPIEVFLNWMKLHGS